MYRWIEHTSELELELESDSERGVFADALTALAELHGLDPEARAELPARRTVTVDAERVDDRASVLAGWLEELVYLSESDGFIAGRLTEFERRDSGLVATVDGVLGQPPPLVKAVTLHRLRFEPQAGGFAARVVLDV